MSEPRPLQSVVEAVLRLNTRGGVVDARALEAYAQRLAGQAERAQARGREAEAGHLRDLAWVHRAAAVQARERGTAGR